MTGGTQQDTVLHRVARRADRELDRIVDAVGTDRDALLTVLGIMFLGVLILLARGAYKMLVL